jgi:hypothetical protein
MTPWKPRSLLVLAALVSLFLAASASAQVGYNPPSLDWLVVRSDRIVRASVKEIARGKPDGQWVWLTVTLDVHATLKGEQARTLTCATHTLTFDKRWDEWKEAKREQLWFLIPPEKPVERGEQANALHLLQLIRLGPPVPAEGRFTSLPPPIFTMDLKVLEDPNEVLRSVQNAVVAKGEGNPPHSHPLWLPRRVMQRSGRSGDANHLTVPINPRLEKLARQLIQSPGDVLVLFAGVPTGGSGPRSRG